MHSVPLLTFFAEARELGESIEAALLALQSAQADADTAGTLFRAMHTLKGSAGLFGLQDIVDFTHAAESLLMRVRDGQLQPAQPLVALLLECHDHLELLLAVAQGEIVDAQQLRLQGTALMERLAARAGPPAQKCAVPAPQPAAVTECILTILPPHSRIDDYFTLAQVTTRRRNVVVVRCGKQRAGIVVDELLGEQQTVIKPLSRIFNGVSGVSGTTILPGGAIALIIDAAALLAECARPLACVV